jgi:hypothetical protein
MRLDPGKGAKAARLRPYTLWLKYVWISFGAYFDQLNNFMPAPIPKNTRM